MWICNRWLNFRTKMLGSGMQGMVALIVGTGIYLKAYYGLPLAFHTTVSGFIVLKRRHRNNFSRCFS
jgi:hypothetical protein